MKTGGTCGHEYVCIRSVYGGVSSSGKASQKEGGYVWKVLKIRSTIEKKEGGVEEEDGVGGQGGGKT